MEAWSDTKQKKSSPTTSHNVYHSLMPVYHISKICGLLPVKFTQDKAGKYSGRVDYLQISYGVLLVLALTGAQCYGLYRDLRNGLQNSTRLSSESSITVTVSDVFAVISASVVAILDSPRRWRYLQQVLNKLVEVDTKLGVPTTKNLRKRAIKLVSYTLVFLFVVSILDYISRYISSSPKNDKYGDKGPINYSPMMLMYAVIFVFEIQYAVVLFHVGEGFIKLNKVIENFTKTNVDVDHIRNDVGLAAQILRHKKSQSTSSDLSTRDSICQSNSSSDDEKVDSMTDAIDQLITIHGMLCDCVIQVNKTYGIAILIGTISCLIHLIITPYFLYNHIYSGDAESWTVIFIVQNIWILFHVYRLLLFVQPCHMITVKAKTTGALVNQALTVERSPEAKKQLTIFSIQLLQRPIEFAACGLFYLNRSLMTSIVGSVTTYLVILVQFQTADDTKDSKTLLQNASELLRNVSSFKLLKSL